MIPFASNETVNGAFHSPGDALMPHWTDSIFALVKNEDMLDIAVHTWLVELGFLIARSISLSTASFMVSLLLHASPKSGSLS